MRRIRNIGLYCFVFLLILGSFKVPELLFKANEKWIETRVFEKKQRQSTIDIEAEKVYLVKAIHDMENSNKSVVVSSKSIASSGTIEKVNSIKDENRVESQLAKELAKFSEFHILDDFQITETGTSQIDTIDRFYQNDDRQYVITDVFFKENAYFEELKIENKTKKILSLSFFSEHDQWDVTKKEEIMRNYVQYLDLYIMDDWQFENGCLSSQKAQLVIYLVHNLKKHVYCLSIHSDSEIFQNLEPIEYYPN